jgi:hypothetical protein
MVSAKTAKRDAFYTVVKWRQDNLDASDFILRAKPKSVILTLSYYPPNNLRADWDNVAGRLKNSQDGIFEALGWDDKLITAAHVYKYPPVKNGKIEYLIEWEE